MCDNDDSEGSTARIYQRCNFFFKLKDIFPQASELQRWQSAT